MAPSGQLASLVAGTETSLASNVGWFPSQLTNYIGTGSKQGVKAPDWVSSAHEQICFLFTEMMMTFHARVMSEVVHVSMKVSHEYTPAAKTLKN